MHLSHFKWYGESDCMHRHYIRVVASTQPQVYNASELTKSCLHMTVLKHIKVKTLGYCFRREEGRRKEKAID